ncbi:MAG: hypothetical protein CMLOHMNK_00449 [Steroidobacteraceae bacterium]|nr:hypothetical protein [Steroidobacteraceae bacterium]
MKFLTSIIVVSAALLSTLPASAGELTQKDFEKFAESRFGPPDGKARYWYGKGPVRDPQTGKTIYVFEYYDTVRHVVDPKNRNKRYGIVRKLDLFRDKDTNEVLETFNGNPVKQWTFPYQLLELEYKDGKVMLTVSQGAGEFLRTHKFPESSIDRYGDFVHVTFPGFFMTRRPEIPDEVSSHTMTSLFITCVKKCNSTPYQWNQSGVSPLAPWAGGDGKKLGYMSMSGARFEKYSQLPQELRQVIDKQYPEFREPAKDLDEVRALQR